MAPRSESEEFEELIRLQLDKLFRHPAQSAHESQVLKR